MRFLIAEAMIALSLTLFQAFARPSKASALDASRRRQWRRRGASVSISVIDSQSAAMRCRFLIHSLFIAGLAASVVFSSSSAFCSTITVGFFDSAEPGFFSQTVTPTTRAIAQKRPADMVTTVSIASVTRIDDILEKRPDVVIVPASVFVDISEKIGAHPIATRKTRFTKNPAASVGAALVVRAERSDLQTLSDLELKTAATGTPDAVDGWLAVRAELRRAGLADQRFFSTVRFLSYPFPEVIMSVLSGRTDVGILPACMLERAEQSGLLEPGRLRVIHEKEDGLSCRHSTSLYPDIVVTALPWTDPELVRDVTLALLSLPEEETFEWLVTSNFQSITALYQELKLGAWRYLDSWSVENLLKRYGLYILAALLAVFLLIYNEVRLQRIVEHRTAALRHALAERDRLEKKAETARTRLAQLERMGAISQLCAMIAHELKQPVGSVVNYMTILKIRLTEAAQKDPVISRAVAGAEDEATRIAAIVDRVRGYAKRQVDHSKPIRLDRAVSHAASYFMKYAGGRERITVGALPEAVILGSSLEIELLTINLLKNAAHAVAETDDPRISVTLAEEKDQWVLTVSDNGPALSDAAFAKLMTVTDSVKEDGLGLGLAIVRNIADEHAARLRLERRSPCGLAVSVKFDRPNAEERKNDNN